jgi:hypothetical protein
VLLGLNWGRCYHFSCLSADSRPEEALFLNYSPLDTEGAEDDLGVGVGDVKLLGGSKTCELVFSYKDHELNTIYVSNALVASPLF